MAAAKKEYTIKDLKKAFEAGAKHSVNYKGNNNFDVAFTYENFEAYKKAEKVTADDEAGEE